MADVKVSALSEATQSELTDSALALASVVDGNSSTGFASRKSTFAKLASYVLNTFSGLSLGGVTRTVKAAIDAIQTTVASHTSTLGSTSISGVGDGTVTGAISSLNSDLANITNRTSATLGSGLSGTAYYTRVGNIVVVTGTITSSGTIAQGATLASGFPRPATGTNFPIYMANNNAVASIFRSYITANGVLMCAENTVSNVSLRFSAAYIAS